MARHLFAVQWTIAAIASWLVAWSLPLAAAPLPPDDRLAQALRFEQVGQWDSAMELYSQLSAEDRQSADLPKRIRQCHRRLQQNRRHAEPACRDRIAALSPAQGLTLFGEVLDKLHSTYVDPSRVSWDGLYQEGIEELRLALKEPSFQKAYLSGIEPAAIATMFDRLRDESARKISDGREARSSARQLAQDGQRLIGVGPSVLLIEMACGAAAALDEFTLLFAPGQAIEEPVGSGADLGALGLGFAWKEGKLFVARVAPDSWAVASGVQPGDRVTHLGTRAIADITVEAASELLRADLTTIGELVFFTTMGLTRSLPLPGYPPSVPEAELVRDGIGYLKLALFHRNTPQEFESALLRLRMDGMRGLILDLRGNPGGVFSVAVQVAERFIASGVIATTESRRNPQSFVASNPMQALDLPLVVLIDGDTASSAEVLAAALKEHQRATLIGQTTFGKGSLQKLLHLQAGSGLKLTLARMFTPRGRPLGGVGVSPHVEVRSEPMKDLPLDAAIEQLIRILGMK